MHVIIRKGMRPYPLKRGSPDPTPEEIAARAAEIRAEWSPQERMSRLRVDWRPMFHNITTNELQEMSADAYSQHCERGEAETDPTPYPID